MTRTAAGRLGLAVILALTTLLAAVPSGAEQGPYDRDAIMADFATATAETATPNAAHARSVSRSALANPNVTCGAISVAANGVPTEDIGPLIVTRQDAVYASHDCESRLPELQHLHELVLTLQYRKDGEWIDINDQGVPQQTCRQYFRIAHVFTDCQLTATYHVQTRPEDPPTHEAVGYLHRARATTPSPRNDIAPAYSEPFLVMPSVTTTPTTGGASDVLLWWITGEGHCNPSCPSQPSSDPTESP